MSIFHDTLLKNDMLFGTTQVHAYKERSRSKKWLEVIFVLVYLTNKGTVCCTDFRALYWPNKKKVNNDDDIDEDHDCL